MKSGHELNIDIRTDGEIKPAKKSFTLFILQNYGIEIEKSSYLNNHFNFPVFIRTFGLYALHKHRKLDWVCVGVGICPEGYKPFLCVTSSRFLYVALRYTSAWRVADIDNAMALTIDITFKMQWQWQAAT